MLPAIGGFPVTFIVKNNFGGGRALPKFFIEEFGYLVERWNMDVSIGDCQFVFVDSDDLEGGNKYEYMRLVYSELGDKRFSKRYSRLLKDIRKRLAELTQRKKVVLFFRAINYLDFADKYFWGNIRSFVSGVDNLGIVFIAYTGGFNLDDKRFSRISELLNQRVVEFNEVADADVKYSIKRWSNVLGKRFDEKEIKAIRRISRGRPMLIKACCMALAGMKNGDDPYLYLKEHAGIRKLLMTNSISFVGNRVKVGNMSVTYIFSEQELDVLKLLYQSKGDIISKDDIATTLWKTRILEKYSESAISQLIRRIRDKLELLEIPRDTILTAHGKGYIFSEK